MSKQDYLNEFTDKVLSSSYFYIVRINRTDYYYACDYDAVIAFLKKQDSQEIKIFKSSATRLPRRFFVLDKEGNAIDTARIDKTMKCEPVENEVNAIAGEDGITIYPWDFVFLHGVVYEIQFFANGKAYLCGENDDEIAVPQEGLIKCY